MADVCDQWSDQSDQPTPEGYVWGCVFLAGHDNGHNFSQLMPDPRSETKMSEKESLLREALRIVTGPRQQLYGRPSQNFIDTSRIMTGYLQARGLLGDDQRLEPFDVAILVVSLKMARIATSPDERDHWVDIAGYAACGYDAIATLGMPYVEGEVVDKGYEEERAHPWVRCKSTRDGLAVGSSKAQCVLPEGHEGHHQVDSIW